MNRRLLRWSGSCSLFLVAAACGGGGGGDGIDGVPSSAESSITVEPLFGIPANGVARTTITLNVRNAAGQNLGGKQIALSVSGSGNILDPVQDLGGGEYVATLASTVAEEKLITATVSEGSGDVELSNEFAARFLAIPADTFFVRQSGSDTEDGRSPITAWATLDFAISQLSPGDTLHVGAGTYTGPLEFSLVGSEPFPYFLRGDVDGSETGDAGPVIIDAAGADAALQISGAQNLIVQGFSLTGAMPGTDPGGGVWVGPTPSNNLSLVELSIYDNERGIRVEGATNLAIEGCRISNQVSDGIVLEATTDVLIDHNLIYNNGRYGLVLLGTESGLTIDLNTFYRNGGDQIRELTAGSDGAITQSILSEGLADGIQLAPGTSLTESRNLVWGNAGRDFNDGAGGGSLDPSDQSADPLFFDPDGVDGMVGGAQGEDDLFLCNLGSPAFDAGFTSAAERELRFGGFLSGYTSRVDGTLDGEGDDGPELNLGYHYPADTQPVDPLAIGDARLFYARQGQSRLSARAFVKDDNAWRASTLTPPTNAEVKWVVNRVSPIEGANEIVAALTDNGAQTDLFVRLWDGVKWSEDQIFNPTISGIPSGQSGQRGFDLEFENESGEALLVYANGGPNPVFQVFSNQSWSEPATVFDVPPGVGSILWVEMVPRLGTNEVALVCLDDEENLTAITWNGVSWDQLSATLLDTQITTTTEAKPYDVAFETDSGDLLVAWGHDLFNEETRYATLSAGSRMWAGPFLNNSADGIGYTIVLASDPASDQIVGAIGEGPTGNDTVGMVWNGEEWGNIAKLDPTSVSLQLDLGLAWVGDTGRAVLLYRDDDGGDTLDWAEFSPGGWTVMDDVPLAGVDDLSRVFVRRLPDADLVSVVLLDVTGELFGLTYNGTTWSFTNGGESLGDGVLVDTAPSKPFSVDFKAR